MTRDTKLTCNVGTPLEDPTPYCRLVGQLIYLLNTRPDFSYSVQQLNQHMSHPTILHHQVVTRVLHYIKKSPAQGLFFPSTSSLQLKAFLDSDWATCLDTRRSITEYCIYLSDSLISWKYNKQPIISRSSTEAEYQVMASTVCELKWLTNLLKDLQISFIQPSLLYCDNASHNTSPATLYFMSALNTLTWTLISYVKNFNLDCFIFFPFPLHNRLLIFLPNLYMFNLLLLICLSLGFNLFTPKLMGAIRHIWPILYWAWMILCMFFSIGSKCLYKTLNYLCMDNISFYPMASQHFIHVIKVQPFIQMRRWKTN